MAKFEATQIAGLAKPCLNEDSKTSKRQTSGLGKYQARLNKLNTEDLLTNESSWSSGKLKMLWTEAVGKEFFECCQPHSAFSDSLICLFIRVRVRLLLLRIISRNQKNRHVESTKLAEYLTTYATGRYRMVYISVLENQVECCRSRMLIHSDDLIDDSRNNSQTNERARAFTLQKKYHLDKYRENHLQPSSQLL